MTCDACPDGIRRFSPVEALVKDLDQIEQGGASVRFIVGRYGSGKTFFLHLVRNVALQRRFVVVEADITTDRRLHGSGGKAQALYSELTIVSSKLASFDWTKIWMSLKNGKP
jgi:hypothetical protein